MKNTIIFFQLFLLTCSNQTWSSHVESVTLQGLNHIEEKKSQSFRSEKPGFLRIKVDRLARTTDSISILNLDGSLFGVIKEGLNGAEPIIVGPKKIDILAYYPDYYIMIFHAKALDDGKYLVELNGEEKLIKSQTGLTIYQTPEQYIAECLVDTDKSNPLRKAPNENAPQKSFSGTYDDIFFEVTEVKGDWIGVRCLKICEGCPKNVLVSGWLKWRSNGKIIVNVSYVC
jgi:hypothetical protein